MKINFKKHKAAIIFSAIIFLLLVIIFIQKSKIKKLKANKTLKSKTPGLASKLTNPANPADCFHNLKVV